MRNRVPVANIGHDEEGVNEGTKLVLRRIDWKGDTSPNIQTLLRHLFMAIRVLLVIGPERFQGNADLICLLLAYKPVLKLLPKLIM